jgi:hypothetical protein
VNTGPAASVSSVKVAINVFIFDLHRLPEDYIDLEFSRPRDNELFGYKSIRQNRIAQFVSKLSQARMTRMSSASGTAPL